MIISIYPYIISIFYIYIKTYLFLWKTIELIRIFKNFSSFSHTGNLWHIIVHIRSRLFKIKSNKCNSLLRTSSKFVRKLENGVVESSEEKSGVSLRLFR